MEGRLLIVEDDPHVRRVLADALRSDGFDIETVSEGQAALAALGTEPPELMVLDLTLPDRDGFEVCRECRERVSALPILIVTARDDVEDRVAAFDCGADDYLTTPVSTAELVARVRSLLRRARGERAADGVLRYRDLQVDPRSREARRRDRQIELTPREFDLLEVLARNPERVLSRQALVSEAWDLPEGTETNAIDVYVGYLRRKLEEAGESRLIWTVRGVGYALREGESEDSAA